MKKLSLFFLFLGLFFLTACDNVTTEEIIETTEEIIETTEEIIETTEENIVNFTIRYEDFDGTILQTSTHDYGSDLSEVNMPEDPVREGYTFDGWDLSLPATMQAKNIFITAQWKIDYVEYHAGDEIGSEFYDGIEDSDGNYITVGRYNCLNESSDAVALIIKYDLNGNILWELNFLEYSSFNSIIEDESGNYVVISDSTIIQLDKSGNVINHKTFALATYTKISSIIEDDEGNYVIVGEKHDAYWNFPSSRVYEHKGIFIKIDSNLDVLVSKEITNFDLDDSFSQEQTVNENWLIDVIQNENGDYIVIGGVKEYLPANPIENNEIRALIIKLDRSGNIIMQKQVRADSFLDIYDEQSFIYLSQLIQNSNGDYIVVGRYYADMEDQQESIRGGVAFYFTDSYYGYENYFYLYDVVKLYYEVTSVSEFEKDLYLFTGKWEMNFIEFNMDELLFGNPYALFDISLYENDLTGLNLNSAIKNSHGDYIIFGSALKTFRICDSFGIIQWIYYHDYIS